MAITDCQIHGSLKKRKPRSKTGKSLKRVRDWSTAEGVRERWDCPVTPGNDRADEWSDSGSRNEHECAKFQAMAESATDREAGGNCN